MRGQGRKFIAWLLVVLSHWSWSANLLAQGTVSFIARRDFRVGETPRSIALGDFNSDTIQDLITVNSFNLSVLLGNGDGTFQEARAVDAGMNPTSVAVADFDSDTIQDLIVRNSAGLVILLGKGDGTFGPP